MITEIPVPPVNDPVQPVRIIRAKLINELNEALKKSVNTEIFEIYTFDKSFLPLVVIRDEGDEVDEASFESLRHTLNVNLNLVTASYKEADVKTAEILQIIAKFKSEFIKKELVNINRSGLEVLDKNYIETQISLNFIYFTPLWSF